jgi:hypothetical protein
MALPFLTSALDGGNLSASRPGRLIRLEIASGAHRIGGWVGRRYGLESMETPAHHLSP